MAVSHDMLGVKGDECDCGRRWTIRHCPSCGSTRLYTRQNRYHKMLDGSIKLVEKQTRCQSCGHEFIEEERRFCEAPPVGQTLAKLKVQRLAEASARGEYLRPEDQKLADIIDKLQTGALPQTQPKKSEVIETLEASVPDEVKELAKQSFESAPDRVEGFVPPNGLTRDEYNVADRAFRLEWAHKKLMGQDTGITVEEYVTRRLKGELFE